MTSVGGVCDWLCLKEAQAIHHCPQHLPPFLLAASMGKGQEGEAGNQAGGREPGQL